ncbi:MAG TPA: DUF2752 domain-containing protein [Verrucomicrobiae bacterium]|jgi:hypothetical protein|nr:DUF2752 domain-containing protein [Verrucomicrobiae bacterium]
MEAPPIIAPAPSPSRSWWWLALAFPALAVAGVLFYFNPSQNSFYPRCSLYVTTGIFCPGCGSSRAAFALLHGHLLTAMHDNLLFVLAMPIIAAYLFLSAKRWLKYEPLPRLILSPLMLKLLIAITVLFTVLRNIPAAPFNWLAPL